MRGSVFFDSLSGESPISNGDFSLDSQICPLWKQKRLLTPHAPAPIMTIARTHIEFSAYGHKVSAEKLHA